jgi:hypothetical protein
MITALIGVGKTPLLKRAPQQKSSTSAGKVSSREITISSKAADLFLRPSTFAGFLD